MSVQDTGRGMDPETQRRMFEPFFTTKEQGKGNGMGLASAYGTIVRHGGALAVHSQEGQGTTVEIFLPLGSQPPPERRSSPADVPPTRRARILVVNDERNLREALLHVLHQLGHEAVACEDGVQAVEHYRSSWHEIDLVILDLVMPTMSGNEALVAMRAINPDVRVLLSSGYSATGHVQAALDQGVAGFLQKPYRVHPLAEAIERALAG